MAVNETNRDLLEAVNLATRKLSGASQVEEVLQEILALCVEAVGTEGGTIYVHNGEKRTLEFRYVLPESSASVLQFADIPDDFGVAGRVFQSCQSEVSQFDVSKSSFSDETGVVVRNMVTAALAIEGMEPFGVVQLINKRDGQFGDADLNVLETIGSVSSLSLINSRLLAEQTRASQLLGMGQVAHDIKNLAFALEANASYSSSLLSAVREDLDAEVVEQLVEVDESLDDLQRSAERIRRYSTIMSDLSAGKALTPTYRPEKVGEVIELSASYLESEARNRGVSLKYEIDKSAPASNMDDMFLFRIVQNLVSNAIKAVAEHAQTGHVEVSYRFDGNGHLIQVQDTGPGMPAEMVQRILSGTATSLWGKSAGSGWGTKIVLELTRAMEGQVMIDSEPGAGTRFKVLLPHRNS